MLMASPKLILEVTTASNSTGPVSVGAVPSYVNYYVNYGAPSNVTVLEPEHAPPHFDSVEEADAWMEQRAAS